MQTTQEKDFDYFVRDPSRWLLKGQTLFIAANSLSRTWEEAFQRLDTIEGSLPATEVVKLIPELDLFQPAAMLAGFSLEVTIKAAIVRNNSHLIRPRMSQFEWTGIRGTSAHDLVALKSKAKIQFDDMELLDTLTKFSIWKGRYPSSMEGVPYYGMQSEFENFGGTLWIDIFHRFRIGYKQLRDQVSQLL
jgi:hypothetical protein